MIVPEADFLINVLWQRKRNARALVAYILVAALVSYAFYLIYQGLYGVF
ncbi:MAG: hypothetical protein UV75_C0008G0047 [Candidatus Giovannonibacteria bacterium GW2011_GWA1_43_15]|uniref:Uncharacterized protein n=1 Tax=Candidatus Giovannonibacteria bacterium GW2011_GWA2_44_26 TaxID=1618648 RepID=A0A0G1LTE6_9BACT|nr:MAG: hypothetical protein UV72_C0002G0045 [Candidatus Giovannonibacteria bacterium GW2011_GWB1_43_13]KKS99213.1 MAG: hypothetical protein UV75_C0008G0047 [Candidatus Giovannonibacteria bacterium GW2011_GWA1_43_15]KKT63014.1 MAG: hypothetical protein UW55_C0007G0054 [Candidatus Giovannonibacteria bacterium GW2011_GWA2_44_26]